MTSQVPFDWLRTLTEAAVSVVGVAQLEELLGRLVEVAMETTGARYAALGVIGEHGTLIEFVHRGIDDATVERIGHLPTGKGLLGTLIHEHTSIRLARITDHPDSIGFPADHPPMESFLGVPVGTSDGAFGRLYLTEKEGGFTDEDEALVGALAAIAGSAVETTRLRSRLSHMAVMEDRRRIGRDLHDSIIQDLFATGLELQGLSTTVAHTLPTGPDSTATAGSDASTVVEAIDRAVDRIDDTIEALRRIVMNLNRIGSPSQFESALRASTGELARAYEIGISVSVTPTDLELDPVLAAELMPMIGEAVSNALRHSGTGTVEVTAEQLADRLFITVTDQGSGFDTVAVTRGLGLDSLESRAAVLGGDLSVRSVVGAGTVVEISVPYTPTSRGSSSGG